MSDHSYHVTQLVIILFGAAVLLAIFFAPLDRGTAERTPRPGALKWFSLFLLVLAAMRILQWLGMAPHHVAMGFASTVNNAFLLIAASHLDYGVEFLKRARQSKSWQLSVFLLTAATAALTAALSGWLPAGSPAVLLPDLLLSAGTLLLLGFGLANTFRAEGFPGLSVLAGLVVLVALSLQLALVEVVPLGRDPDLLRSLSTVTLVGLISLFVALGVVWGHRMAAEAEQRREDTSTRIVFTNRPSESAPSRIVIEHAERRLEASHQPYRDLLTLAEARMQRGQGGGWVHISQAFNSDYKRIERIRDIFIRSEVDPPITNRHPGFYRLTIPPELIDVTAHSAGAAASP